MKKIREILNFNKNSKSKSIDLSICTIYDEKDIEYLNWMQLSLPPRIELILMKTVPEMYCSDDKPKIEKLSENVTDNGSIIKNYKWKYYCEDINDPWNPEKENQFSFSDAKNACKEQATRKLILFLDADEMITNWYAWPWERLLDLDDNIGGVLIRIYSFMKSKSDPLGEDTITRTIRIIPNKNKIKYKYRVHEQLRPSLQENHYETIPTNILLHHFGYTNGSKEMQIEKCRRNLYLMNKDLIKKPYSSNLKGKEGEIVEDILNLDILDNIKNKYLLDKKAKTIKLLTNLGEKV